MHTNVQTGFFYASPSTNNLCKWAAYGEDYSLSPVNIPTRLNMDDHYQNYTGVTEDINKAIKVTTRTITKSKLSDKIHSEVLLQKSGLKCLNEAVASTTAVTV